VITKKAMEKIRQEQEGEPAPPPVVVPELATLEYRTSDNDLDRTTRCELGKFANRFVVFGNFTERDRQIYLTKHKRYLDLRAGLDEVTDEDLLKEPQAEAYLYAETTMSKDGFTTKELTTQRVYESAGRPREATGFWGRLLGRGARTPQAEEIE